MLDSRDFSLSRTPMEERPKRQSNHIHVFQQCDHLNRTTSLMAPEAPTLPKPCTSPGPQDRKHLEANWLRGNPR